MSDALSAAASEAINAANAVIERMQILSAEQEAAVIKAFNASIELYSKRGIAKMDVSDLLPEERHFLKRMIGKLIKTTLTYECTPICAARIPREYASCRCDRAIWIIRRM